MPQGSLLRSNYSKHRRLLTFVSYFTSHSGRSQLTLDARLSTLCFGRRKLVSGVRRRYASFGRLKWYLDTRAIYRTCHRDGTQVPFGIQER